MRATSGCKAYSQEDHTREQLFSTSERAGSPPAENLHPTSRRGTSMRCDLCCSEHRRSREFLAFRFRLTPGTAPGEERQCGIVHTSIHEGVETEWAAFSAITIDGVARAKHALLQRGQFPTAHSAHLPSLQTTAVGGSYLCSGCQEQQSNNTACRFLYPHSNHKTNLLQLPLPTIGDDASHKFESFSTRFRVVFSTCCPSRGVRHCSRRVSRTASTTCLTAVKARQSRVAWKVAVE